MLDKSNVIFATVPANCTDPLQPSVVSVNKAAKGVPSQTVPAVKFVQLESKTTAQADDLALSVVKPLIVHVKWMMGIHDYMHTHTEIIKN